MAGQTISVELSEDMYQRLQDAARVTHMALQDVLFQTIRGNLPPSLTDLSREGRNVAADLPGMADDALWSVVKEPLPAPRWRRHQHLLRKGESASLTPTEQAELATLREETDRLVTRRSYALALLKWRGYSVPSSI